jgi:hypothetical protein
MARNYGRVRLMCVICRFNHAISRQDAMDFLPRTSMFFNNSRAQAALKTYLRCDIFNDTQCVLAGLLDEPTTMLTHPASV